ncbi:MAG: Crp/Fnr family transcriptional regulator [Planctomycetales bacterium]
MSEQIWFLKKCDLFEQLSQAELERLETRAQLREFPRKSMVYLPTQEARSVFLLTSGRVKISNITQDGKQAILAFIDPGELFGELAVFDSSEREDYAETMEKSTVVMIPAEEVRLLMEQHAHLSMGVTKLIGLRRRRIERRLKHLLFRSNRERLIHLLLDLAEQYGYHTEQGVQLSIKLSHQDLASVIGSTRESVTVALGELQAERYLRIDRRRITLLQTDRLAAVVSTEPPQIGPAENSGPNSAVQFR